MEALDFGAEVIAISASGVLAPGPLFFTNLLYGTRQGATSGLKVATGHTVVELPLIIVIATGLFSSTALAASQSTSVIGLVGGIAILGFAALQIAAIAGRKVQLAPIAASSKSPFVAGIALSALNPFFLVWWLTAGLKLIADSASFGLVTGIALLFGLHIWMDYAWLMATAYLASKGSSVLRSKYYPMLLLGLAAILAYYGAYFVIHSIYKP